MQNQIAELLIDGEIEPAKMIFYNEAIPSQEKAMSLMGEFIALQHIHNSMELSHTSREIEFEKKVIAALLVFGLVISFIIASRVVAKINKEIEQRNKIENELEERVERRTRELTYLASHDSLTELPNRTVFNEQLGNSIQQAKRYKKCSALLFLDLDGFKAINDGYGHAAGDYALREVAAKLKHIIRGSDVLARVGGDEFTIILNDVKEESNATRICEQVIESLNQPIDFSGLNLQLGVSIGITFFMNDRRSADELLTEADDAMYIAKDLGKNRMQISKHADRESNVHPFPGERSNA
ncbi:GGDEF domain-containing protein [Candidatus Reidiella endopervernicosa]|uniref:GGDEF domain-containing protein n=1 Tax=Candidatus Reidiella endopervernicosa TaxID=2738883 RepID=A0A6N0HZ69_9GAMM|nr:GGDEF domain-containing protein [Candidatus Reidiella endopervernicosa]QKQ27597.1 GGDEF domain-containing protein [Candidatus Reidiella endopervernicosa]